MAQKDTNETSSWHLGNFEALSQRLARPANKRDKEPSTITTLRKEAYSRFDGLQFPTVRQEDWKYTNVAAPLTRNSFTLGGNSRHEPIPVERIEPLLIGGVSAPRAVFVNGNYSESLSSIPSTGAGVYVGSIADLLHDGNEAERSILEDNLARYATYEDRPFIALNTAFLSDGAYVRIAKNAIVEEPIQLVFVSVTEAELNGHDGIAVHPRVLIVAEAGTQATVVEVHAGLDDGERFTNPVTEAVIAESAVVEHFKVQLEGSSTYHVASLDVQQAENSVFTSHSYTFEGKLSRNTITPVLAGEGSECNLNGLYVLGGDQHADTHSVIDHATPHCDSNELYKGVLSGTSHGVFSGKIVVREGAQKTNAFQSNKNLLLSKDATIDSKPQLEIFADDVKCSHGATVGQIDEQALFYLRSRGIDRDAAFQILVHAFTAELLDSVKSEPLRSSLEQLLVKNLRTKA